MIVSTPVHATHEMRVVGNLTYNRYCWNCHAKNDGHMPDMIERLRLPCTNPNLSRHPGHCFYDSKNTREQLARYMDEYRIDQRPPLESGGKQ